ncbi:hypothetical protein [Mesorhizobium sp.]|nr:hypothetical protein [Mesorhizobium sp.]
MTHQRGYDLVGLPLVEVGIQLNRARLEHKHAHHDERDAAPDAASIQ